MAALLVAAVNAWPGAVLARAGAAATPSTALPVTTSWWGALITAPGAAGVFGEPLALAWSTVGHNFGDAIGIATQYAYLDALNIGPETLTGERYLFTVTGWGGQPRDFGLWLCAGGTWDLTTDQCAPPGVIVAAGSVSVSGNGTFGITASGDAETMAPEARLSFLVTVTGGRVPRGAATNAGIAVSRTLSVRPGMTTEG